MKKAITLLLVFLVSVSLISCTGSNDKSGNNSGNADNSNVESGISEGGNKPNESGKKVVFEPIADDLSALKDSDIYEAAAVLEKRLTRAGYKNFNITKNSAEKKITVDFEKEVTKDEMSELVIPPRKINIRSASGEVIMTSDNVSMASSHGTSSSNADGYENGVQHIVLLLKNKVKEDECDTVYMDDTLISQNITECDDSRLYFDVDCTEEEAASKALVTEIYEGSRYPVRLVSIEN